MAGFKAQSLPEQRAPRLQASHLPKVRALYGRRHRHARPSGIVIRSRNNMRGETDCRVLFTATPRHRRGDSDKHIDQIGRFQRAVAHNALGQKARASAGTGPTFTSVNSCCMFPKNSSGAAAWVREKLLSGVRESTISRILI